MKLIKNLSFIFFAISIMASCSNSDTNTLVQKKDELLKLKEERKTLNSKILALEKDIAKLDSNSAFASKAKLISVRPLAYQTFTNFIEIMGKIDAELNTTVSSEIPGVIHRIAVHTGQSVSIGQTLGEIDNTVSSIAVNELKQQIEFAKTIYEKQKNLWDQKIGTEVQFISAKNNYEALQKRLQTTNQQLGMARIKSPINGVVDDVFAKIGQTVAPGVPCFRIVNTSKLKVRASVAESYAGKIKQGNNVHLFFPDLNLEAKGSVSFVSKIIDPINRAFNVEIPIDSDENYKPNMMAQIKIADYQNDKALIVPINTIRTIGSKSYVMLATETNGIMRATKREVTFTWTYNGQTEISTGLNEGDKLITVGYQELEDGDEIKF